MRSPTCKFKEVITDTSIILFDSYIHHRKIPTHHSIASSNPSPLIADVLKMAHVLFLRAERPRAVEISEGDMAPSMS